MFVFISIVLFSCFIYLLPKSKKHVFIQVIQFYSIFAIQYTYSIYRRSWKSQKKFKIWRWLIKDFLKQLTYWSFSFLIINYLGLRIIPDWTSIKQLTATRACFSYSNLQTSDDDPNPWIRIWVFKKSDPNVQKHARAKN